MSGGEVYFSNFFSNTGYTRGWVVDWDAPGWRDLKVKRLPADSDLPLPIYSSDRMETFVSLPPAVQCAGGFIVSYEMADVFRRFDLGGDSIVPAQLFRFDRVTPVEHEYFVVVLAFIDKKVCFLPDISHGVQPFPYDAAPNKRWMEVSAKIDDIAVSSTARIGTDVWIDPMIPSPTFFSGRLVDALKTAGFQKVFEPVRCRVVERN